MQKPIHDDPEAECPLWQTKCVKKCHRCEWWRPLRIESPTVPGQMIDKWMCSIVRIGELGLANLQAQRQTSSQVQEFRNETKRENAGAIVGVLGHLNAQVREAMQIEAPLETQKLIEN